MSLTRLKKVLKEEQVTLGANETLRKLKGGKVTVVFLASDSKPALREQLQHYHKVQAFELVDLDIVATELGNLCKKQFPVSVLSY